MGIILFGMLCGELPFNCESNYDTATKISKADYHIPAKIKSKLTKPCVDMITKLL